MPELERVPHWTERLVRALDDGLRIPGTSIGVGLDAIVGALLPGDLIYSYAYSIDTPGNIYGIAFGSTGGAHAVMWSPIPEPTSLMTLGLAGAALLAWRRERSTPRPRI